MDLLENDIPIPIEQLMKRPSFKNIFLSLLPSQGATNETELKKTSESQTKEEFSKDQNLLPSSEKYETIQINPINNDQGGFLEVPKVHDFVPTYNEEYDSNQVNQEASKPQEIQDIIFHVPSTEIYHQNFDQSVPYHEGTQGNQENHLNNEFVQTESIQEFQDLTINQMQIGKQMKGSLSDSVLYKNRLLEYLTSEKVKALQLGILFLFYFILFYFILFYFILFSYFYLLFIMNL